jgi:uncharacterized protein (TIGR00369 family)
MDEVRARSERALAVPLLRFLDASLADRADGFWSINLRWGRNALNAVDALHGGVIATVLDVAAYLAAAPHLATSEEAVTVAFSASYLAAAEPDRPLQASGEFIRRTRHVAFVTAELRSEERPLALATVTKAVLSAE